MILRAVTAALVAAATLHAGATRAEACESHDAVTAPAPVLPHHDGMDHGDAGTPAEQAPCEGESAECCVAVAACGVELPAEATVAAGVSCPQAMVVAAAAAPPGSLPVAPEPPPPRG